MTGGSGFVGKWLLAILLEADRRYGLDCELVVLSREPHAFESQVPHLASARGLQLHRGDIRDFTFPPGRFGVVIHAATDVVAVNSPLQTFDVCRGGTQHVLDFAVQAGTTDFLLISSGAIYGRQPPDMAALTEDYPGAPDPMSPESAYGQGKRASEWLTAATAAEFGMRAVAARLFAFVGPSLPLDKQFAIGNFLRDALAGRSIAVKGDGTPHRSYLYAADMAAWIWKILFIGTAGTAYNVGGEESVSIGELAQRITNLLESPASVSVQTVARPGTPAERYVPNVSKARRELAIAQTLSLDESIRRTAQWHRQIRAAHDNG